MSELSSRVLAMYSHMRNLSICVLQIIIQNLAVSGMHNEMQFSDIQMLTACLANRHHVNVQCVRQPNRHKQAQFCNAR